MFAYRSHALSLLLALPLIGCEAELEVQCRDGTCEEYPVPIESDCPEDACLAVEGTDTGDLPCDVYWVLENTCQRCHVAGGQGPFELKTYDNTQAIYGAKPIWERMKPAVNLQPETGVKMPLDSFPTTECRIAILNNWFETCEADHCIRRSEIEGTGGIPNQGGAGGGGGSGGAGGSGMAGAGGVGGVGGGP